MQPVVDRRETLLGAAAVAVGAAIASTATAVRQTLGLAPTIRVGAKRYPLSARFAGEVGSKHPDLLSLPYEQLEAMRDALLQLSTRRHNFQAATPQAPLAMHGTLTLAEQDRLVAIVHVINVHNGVNFLQGRDHAEFGFEGVDQIHGNAHHLACGCILHVVFDHHRRGEEGLELQPHHPRVSCAAHQAHLPDFRAHAAAARAAAALTA
jgi:hypothetical protein